MKVAIYIENGVTQVVLTPEGDWEDQVCAKLASDGAKDVTIRRGSFYECQGGWIRFDSVNRADRSLILRVDDVREPEPPSVSPTRSPSDE